MADLALRGEAASPGTAVGPSWRDGDGAPVSGVVAPGMRDREVQRALRALTAAESELDTLAQRLQDGEQAEIVRAGALMAADPALAAAVEAAVRERGVDAPGAVLQATDLYATTIAALDDETLAARADDVRSLGRRAARLARGEAQAGARPGSIAVTTDVGPADVAEWSGLVAGIAQVGGGATAHAAIVARSLGLPMVTGLPAELLQLDDGEVIVLDGDAGTVTARPTPAVSAGARRAMSRRRKLADRARAERDLPAVTRDGHQVTVLANVASVAEAELALRDGAEGIGLLRTELAFMNATAWPREIDHRRAIDPILAAMGDRPAVIRVLDLGVDKAPPFLGTSSVRGIGLMLRHPEALASQLRALVTAGAHHDVRVLLPMVDRTVQLSVVRELLCEAAADLACERIPALGAMVETPGAAGNASALAARCDFISIGTNDLTATALGVDRFGAGQVCAHHPRVLALIARTVNAAHDTGIRVEVCGEAASDPLMLPLLVGLGVDEVSVGAARVGTVRRWVRRLEAGHVRALAQTAIGLGRPEQVAAAVESIAGELAAFESGHAGDQGSQRGGRILALGA